MALELPTSINETLSKSKSSTGWNTKTDGIKINNVNSKEGKKSDKVSEALKEVFTQSNLSKIADNAVSKTLSSKVTGFKSVSKTLTDAVEKEVTKQLSSVALSNLSIKDKDMLNKLINTICSNNGLIDSNTLNNIRSMFNNAGLKSIFCKVDPKHASAILVDMASKELPNKDLKTVAKSLVHTKKIDGKSLLKIAKNTTVFKDLKTNTVNKFTALGKTVIKSMSKEDKHSFKDTVKKLHNDDEPLGNDSKFVEIATKVVKEKDHSTLPVDDSGVIVTDIDTDTKDFLIGKLGNKEHIA